MGRQLDMRPGRKGKKKDAATTTMPQRLQLTHLEHVVELGEAGQEGGEGDGLRHTLHKLQELGLREETEVRLTSHGTRRPSPGSFLLGAACEDEHN